MRTFFSYDQCFACDQPISVSTNQQLKEAQKSNRRGYDGYVFFSEEELATKSRKPFISILEKQMAEGEAAIGVSVKICWRPFLSLFSFT